MIIKLFCAKFNWWISLVSGVRKKLCSAFTISLLYTSLLGSVSQLYGKVFISDLLIVVESALFCFYSMKLLIYFLFPLLCILLLISTVIMLAFWNSSWFFDLHVLSKNLRETYWGNRITISNFVFFTIFKFISILMYILKCVCLKFT